MKQNLRWAIQYHWSSLLIYLVGNFIIYLWRATRKLKHYSKISVSSNLYLNCTMLKWAATCQNQQSDCAPSDSDQPEHPPSLIRVFAVRIKKDWIISSHWAHSENSDQTRRMPRLLWVFAGRTLILFVLSWDGSNYFLMHKRREWT